MSVSPPRTPALPRYRAPWRPAACPAPLPALAPAQPACRQYSHSCADLSSAREERGKGTSQTSTTPHWMPLPLSPSHCCRSPLRRQLSMRRSPLTAAVLLSCAAGRCPQFGWWEWAAVRGVAACLAPPCGARPDRMGGSHCVAMTRCCWSPPCLRGRLLRKGRRRGGTTDRPRPRCAASDRRSPRPRRRCRLRCAAATHAMTAAPRPPSCPPRRRRWQRNGQQRTRTTGEANSETT